MFCKVLSARLCGVEACPVRVEADISDGLPQFNMVGYLGAEVKEAQDRVRSALRNAGIAVPPKRITVNLAPAGVRKAGSRFDLAVAVVLLGAMEKIPMQGLDEIMIAGELSLSGQVLPVPGILPMALCAKEAGLGTLIVPKPNAVEGAVCEDMRIIGVANIPELIEYLRKRETLKPVSVDVRSLLEKQTQIYNEDFADVRGQESICRAAEVAAAGMHNFLMIGPPGTGKTMIARRIPGIMPKLSLEESIEITKIYSVAGLLDQDEPLMLKRPFRSPHHTATPEALAGGGRIPVPGEVSLSTGGILFLDELPEFGRSSIEILRQPLEERRICISRSAGTYVFPAKFMLVAAMNPCACGYFPDRRRCRCSRRDISRYLGRISQPILDRIDICVWARALTYDELEASPPNESSSVIRARVCTAIDFQRERYEKEDFGYNSYLGARTLKKYCETTPEAGRTLESAYRNLGLSVRTYHRILKITRTLADLEGESLIKEGHVLEALGYRPPDRNDWLKEVV